VTHNRENGATGGRGAGIVVRGSSIAVHVSRPAVRDFPNAVWYFP